MTALACFDCGAPAEHMHHVVPRSRGGTRTVPLCGRCHALAHGLDGATWASHRTLTRNALAAKRTRGERAGEVPYGFTADAAGKLAPDAAEQAVITNVRAMHAAGLSLRAIVAELTRAGRVSRVGKPFAAMQVSRMARCAA